MPYINKKQREIVDSSIDSLVVALNQAIGSGDPSGGLNYTITTLLLRYTQGRWPKFRYFISPMVRGVLADVSTEFYRRVVALYEDEKIKSEGDLKELQK